MGGEHSGGADNPAAGDSGRQRIGHRPDRIYADPGVDAGEPSPLRPREGGGKHDRRAAVPGVERQESLDFPGLVRRVAMDFADHQYAPAQRREPQALMPHREDGQQGLVSGFAQAGGGAEHQKTLSWLQASTRSHSSRRR